MHIEKTEMIASDTPEPHKVRRREILAKIPKVTDLFEEAPDLKWITIGEFLLQWITAIFVAPHLSPMMWCVVAYVIGATCGGSLFLAIHEISHGHAFSLKKPNGLLKNRIIGFVADFGLLLPVSTSFRRYHLDHHAYQGVYGKDPDLPTEWECRTFKGPVGKLAWLLLQPVFYTLRPVLCHPKKVTKWEFINYGLVILAGYVLYMLTGSMAAHKYIWTSSVIGASLHPMAAHFVAEHVVLPEDKSAETHSYYGSLNCLAFNVGYHNEHHDFPQVAYHKLKALKALAHEEYEKVSIQLSWPGAMLRFVMDPKITVSSRVTRETVKGNEK